MNLKIIKTILLTGSILTTSLLGIETFAPNHAAATANNLQAKISASNTISANIIRTGNRYLGVKYQYGAEYETSHRFDCSSFTQFVFKKQGIQLPRSARQQYTLGARVSKHNLKVGDLVFFSTLATKKYSRHSIKRIGHVGIYAGNNRILHTFGKGGVQYDSITHGWWSKNYIGAVRVSP